MHILQAFLIVSSLVLLLGGVATAQEWTTIPTATEMYQLQYTFSGVGVTFEVTAQTKGYVGFGFSNISGMVQSDIFIGGVLDDGSVYSGDYSSVTVGRPDLDSQQDWEVLEAFETPTATVIRFRREFDTSDPKDIPITANLMNIIWAMGPSDSLVYHGFTRSNLKFNLDSGTNEGNEPEPPPTQRL